MINSNMDKNTNSNYHFIYKKKGVFGTYSQQELWGHHLKDKTPIQQ